MHYYQFNIGDYTSSTAHLEPLEDIAYRRILDLYYSTEKPLTDDIESLSRLIRMRTHSECIANVLREFFVLEKDGWHCERVDIEIFKFHEKADKARDSAKARWKKHKENQKVTDKPKEDANALRPQSERNANHKPLTTNQKPINKKEKINKKNTARGTRLDKNWKPSIELINFCNSERPDLNPQTVVNTFLDYWVAQPGQKGVKLDWDATWRNWVRNSRKEFKQQAKPEKFNVADYYAQQQKEWREQNAIND